MVINRRTSGSVLVIVLACISIMAISFYSIVEYILSQKRQVVKTNHILELKFAMNSTVDFVLFGVKQKYCFAESLMSDPNCKIDSEGSTERLIMSMEQVNFLLAAGKITPLQATTIRLSKITRDLVIADIATGHPLYGVLSHIQNQKELSDIKYIHVVIERNDSAFLPRSGNEVYLNVSVSLTRNKGDATVLNAGRDQLQVVSHLVIYPRELGSFALLIPRDLYLGSNDKNPQPGDIHFYGAADKNQFSGLPGLLFLSPVFVNRDIILNQASYSPVTFADRIYLGEGRVQVVGNSGVQPFKPLSKGGETGRYWREVSSFGGFLKGVENDGARDAGLRAFIGGVSTTAPSENLMSKCIDRNLSQADLGKVLNSRLAIFPTQSASSKFNYILNLTNSEFSAQRRPLTTNLQNWDKGTLNVNADADAAYKRPVMDLTLKVGSRTVDFSLPKKAEVTAVVEVGSPQYESKLRDDLQQAQAALQVVMGKPDATPEQIKQSQVSVKAAKDKLAEYLDMVANPPKISIITDPILRGQYESKTNLSFNVSIENPTHLLDQNGNLVSPEIVMKVYDQGYMDGQFIGKRNDAWRNHGHDFLENPNLNQKFNFTFDPATSAMTSATSSPGTVPPTDFEDLGDLCMSARDAMESQAFGMADATVSFAATTRTSWNFAGLGTETGASAQDPLVSSIQFDSHNAVSGANNSSFQVRSIVGTCIIKDTANFVTGFFTCDRLIIEQRKTPLRIIGTFIAGNVDIHPDAFKAGIVWSSLYHPQAVAELRREGILKRVSSNSACGNSLTSPIWHPIPSIQEVEDRMTCNVISLRAKADPFQWTAVDPDCGLLPGSSNTTCKKRLIRFFVIEQDREGAI